MFKYFAILLVIFIAGVPVAVAMGGSATLLLILERGFSNFNPAIIAQKSCYGLNNFLLLSIPLFLYAGKIMNTGNITNRIFNFCKSLVGWLHGGLGHVNIMASVIFAGMTGTATSDAAGLGQIEIQAMREAGYDDEFTFGITAGSSLIGPIIPPSIPLVIYGMMTGVSIGKLLIGGIVPGVILALALGIYVEIAAKRKGYPRDTKFDAKKIWKDFKASFLSLLTPIIIIGGIMSGVFTATEAAAIAALYATILTTVVYKEIDFKGLCKILWETVRDSGSIMMICYCASCYGYVITKSRVAQKLAASVMTLTTNPFWVCMLLVGVLLIMGCFMENLATITIMAPVFYPLLVNVGFDPLAFGLIMILSLMIGLLTPPFGMVLFVLSKVGNYPLQKMIKAALPFIFPVLLVIIILALCPEIITFLPNALL